jgi:hypothetical protein
MNQADRARPHSQPEDKASAYFSVLTLAQAKGDYATAAKAQRLLARLGWVVTRRKTGQATRGQGGGR